MAKAKTRAKAKVQKAGKKGAKAASGPEKAGKKGAKAAVRPANKPKVIIYTTGTCPYCHMAKDYLKGRGIAYEDFDVGLDLARAQEMIRKSGQLGVPVLEINGKMIVGFNRNAIDEALAGR